MDPSSSHNQNLTEEIQTYDEWSNKIKEIQKGQFLSLNVSWKAEFKQESDLRVTPWTRGFTHGAWVSQLTPTFYSATKTLNNEIITYENSIERIKTKINTKEIIISLNDLKQLSIQIENVVRGLGVLSSNYSDIQDLPVENQLKEHVKILNGELSFFRTEINKFLSVEKHSFEEQLRICKENLANLEKSENKYGKEIIVHNFFNNQGINDHFFNLTCRQNFLTKLLATESQFMFDSFENIKILKEKMTLLSNPDNHDKLILEYLDKLEQSAIVNMNRAIKVSWVGNNYGGDASYVCDLALIMKNTAGGVIMDGTGHCHPGNNGRVKIVGLTLPLLNSIEIIDPKSFQTKEELKAHMKKIINDSFNVHNNAGARGGTLSVAASVRKEIMTANIGDSQTIKLTPQGEIVHLTKGSPQYSISQLPEHDYITFHEANDEDIVITLSDGLIGLLVKGVKSDKKNGLSNEQLEKLKDILKDCQSPFEACQRIKGHCDKELSIWKNIHGERVINEFLEKNKLSSEEEQALKKAFFEKDWSDLEALGNGKEEGAQLYLALCNHIGGYEQPITIEDQSILAFKHHHS